MSRNISQPTFDFLTGEEHSPRRQPLGETLRQSTITRPDVANESLRAQLNTLQYELDSLKQEKEVTALQHASDLRDAEKRAEHDYRRAQTAESNAQQAQKKMDQLSRDLADSENRQANEKMQLERKVRSLHDDNQSLREDLEDAESRLSSAEREQKHALGDLDARYQALHASFEDAQNDLESKVSALQSTQQRLSQRESDVGNLENEILRLKAQTGDSDTLAIIKRELSEQVAHIKKLEQANRDQLTELRQLRKTHKSVDVVNEEKRVLETKIRVMEDLRKELAEAQLQKQILEDEKHTWTSYLQSEAAGKEELAFDSPEAMAKAFVTERFERLTLVEKLGALQPELAVRDDSIKTLEDEKAQLNTEIEKLKTSAGQTPQAVPVDAKARARLERQKNLAIKEVEYLRAQMKAFEAEENEFQPEKMDQDENNRIQELESLIDQYRSEVESLATEMKNLESSTAPQPSQQTLKRAHAEEESDERLGELRRKLRTLQDDLNTLQTRNSSLETELQAKTTQLSALRESSRTRVLELRDNPTSQTEAIKLTTLNVLRQENSALLAQLEGKNNGGTKVVPISTLENARLQIRDLENTISQRDLKQKRLKDIWTAKFLEFAEAVSTTLGWKVVFQPNGRFKITSILYPCCINKDGEEEENSILFDAEKGTMKVSGGPQSLFANEIRPMIEFWVDGRNELPCFLAALTLEFYERTTRAGVM